MNREFDVLCLGQIVQDILVTDVPVDALTSGNDTYLAGMVKASLGGDAANEAATLAKLGNHAAFLGRVGKDATGEALMHAMEDVHIDTSLAVRSEECKNFSTVVVIKQDSKHTFLVGPGEKFLLEESDIDFSLLEKTRALSIGSLYALGELEKEGIKRVCDAVHKAGGTVFADMTFDFDNIGPRALDYVYGSIDYLVPSFSEANFVTGETDPDRMADFFLNAGAKNVAIKLGGDGCFFKNASERFFTDPFDVNPVNTTGCGDNFTGAFIHSVLRGDDHETCCRFACATGALNSLGVGASLYVRDRQHVLDFMGKTQQRKLGRS